MTNGPVNDESMLTTVAKAVGTTAGIIVAKATRLKARAVNTVKNEKPARARRKRKAKATAKKRTTRASTRSRTRKPAAKSRTRAR